MDLLSGSYSSAYDMAGLFHVLWGSKDGLQSAKVLKGTDEEPLVIPARKGDPSDKLCTRPFAADIDADGDLDLLVGNLNGSFFVFDGEGDGMFDPKPSFLKDKDGSMLRVGRHRDPQHSDPFLVDWDNDGDLDLVSGSNGGGVSLAINSGNREEYQFLSFKEIFPRVKSNYGSEKNTISPLKQPQGYTRVWVDDINGDGKFDILVGDSAKITTAADGVKQDEVEELLEVWEKNYQGLSRQHEKLKRNLRNLASDEARGAKNADGRELSERERLQKEMDRIAEKISGAIKKRGDIVSQENTGFVWVYYQK